MNKEAAFRTIVAGEAFKKYGRFLDAVGVQIIILCIGLETVAFFCRVHFGVGVQLASRKWYGKCKMSDSMYFFQYMF